MEIRQICNTQQRFTPVSYPQRTCPERTSFPSLLREGRPVKRSSARNGRCVAALSTEEPQLVKVLTHCIQDVHIMNVSAFFPHAQFANSFNTSRTLNPKLLVINFLA